MTGAQLLWNVDLRMHDDGHWVAVGVLAGMRWEAPDCPTATLQNLGGFALAASGPDPNAARANLQALARLRSIRMGEA